MLIFEIALLSMWQHVQQTTEILIKLLQMKTTTIIWNGTPQYCLIYLNLLRDHLHDEQYDEKLKVYLSNLMSLNQRKERGK